MSNLFEIFNPDAAHWRRQRDLDKVAVVPSRNGAQGPMRVDLDKGTIVLPTRAARNPDATQTEAPTQEPEDTQEPEATQEPTEGQ
jgi:hypothetical protein